MVSRQQIADEARRHLGTFWLHQGRTEGVGLDCLGLVVVTARNLGFDVEDCVDYEMRPDPDRLSRMVRKQLVEVAEPKLGSVLLLHFNHRTRTAFHFGIVTGPDSMVHGYAPARKVVEHPLSERWREHVSAIFDFPELTD